MDKVAVTGRKHINKKENKENAEPTHGSKSFIKRAKTSVAPLPLKSNDRVEPLAKSGPLNPKAKQTETVAQKKLRTVQKDGKGAVAVTDVKQQEIYSRVFFTEQSVKLKKIVSETSKPPSAVPSSRPAPGLYKGKIVQSKIGSIWKSSVTMGGADPKPAAQKTENHMVGNVPKGRSKSVSDLPGPRMPKPTSARSKSAFSRPAQVSKPTVTNRPFARTMPATLTNTSSRNTAVAPTKVNRPSVSSTLSQYRCTRETAEEKKTKLAEWLASKGKTLKRPAMTTAGSTKVRVSAKPDTHLKFQSHVELEPAAQSKPQSDHCVDAELLTESQTQTIMNTTLELLEDSDANLPVDSKDNMDDIVVNLCHALEAMLTPSSGDVAQVTADVQKEDGEPKDECTEEVKNEMPWEGRESLKVEKVKNEEENRDEVEMDDFEEVESHNEGVTTPKREDASVIKYSVKTTPYLQSVKKTIGEASTSTSGRKSNIKDLKFLTPVRRSCRIQRNTSHLPSMLLDHDPCVSSLAELVKLDDDPNAYIYRKNPVLLEDLPDQA
ncbi:cytoskeleton-associated protein 2 [Mastacembelus armatus]|uniref:cytoskeleton-associated protein 2 n=1 Tax=Mastacembelus armatus TaxID=205130 RepID=UPI000E45DDB2|nr:cytoskeleton-associated protein 2-like [Mastacembelus armatus]